MDKLTASILALVGIVVFLLLGSLVGLLAGSLVGAIAGLFFPQTLGLISVAIFGTTLPAWQLGAALGFVGGFFKARVSVDRD